MKLFLVLLCSLPMFAEEPSPSLDFIRVLNEAHARERAASKRGATVAKQEDSRRTVAPRPMSNAEREELRQAIERFVRENPGVLIDVRTGKPFETPAKDATPQQNP